MRTFRLAIFCLLLASLPGGWALAQVRSDYRVAPHDSLVIDVFGERDMSRKFKVSTTGTINYFFVGEIVVAGKTTTEIRDELTKLLDADYLVEPQVTVEVEDYRIREVFVNGQVNKPGSIVLTGDQELTILAAIFRAGGLTPRASENKIKFTRPGERERVLSLDDLKNPKNNVTLQSGDIIEVGDKLL